MKNFLYFFLEVLCTLALFIGPTKGDEWSNTQTLRKKLLKNYDKNISPHGGSNGTTVVEYGMVVNDISVNEDHQTFCVSGLVIMHWTDKRLIWNSKDFAGEEELHFENDDLWKPDLIILNAADGTDIDHFAKSRLTVFNNGLVLWAPTAFLEVPCTLDLKFWPFDTQNCKITLMSLTHDGFEVNVQLYNNETKISTTKFMRTEHPWKILEAKQNRHVYKSEETKEYFNHLDSVFTIKRNSPTFGSFVIVPAVGIPLFLMVQFILPVDHSRRLLIGFVCSLLVMMELLFLKFSLPKLGTNVPLIVSFYSECFMIVILTIVLSSILGRLTHPTNPLLDFPPPESIKNNFTGRLATILRVETDIGMRGNTIDDDVEELANKYPNYSHEWIVVAKVVDRISFILITCIFILSLLCFVAPIH